MHHAHFSIFPALSIAVAILGAWTALDLAGRMRAHLGAARMQWLAVAALALGASIWSMHFIAMLGFAPGTPVSYDLPLTLLSLLLAVAGAGAALIMAEQPSAGVLRLSAAGILMGLAIASMHYVGMAALRTAAIIQYRPGVVVLSVIIAIVASTAALLVVRRERVLSWKIIGAIILGLAIASMHYVGMAAIILVPIEGHHASDMSGAGSPLALAIAVSGGSMAVLCLALGASMLDQRTNLLLAIDAGGVGFWEASIPVRSPLLSARAREMLGPPFDEPQDAFDISKRLAPEDVVRHRQAVQNAVSGLTDYDEEWYLPATGRWVHLRGRLIRSRSGRPIRLSGVITDVTDRREAFAALAASERQQTVLINELNHRVKNTLATVQSIARQTARRSTDVGAFFEMFESRLLALSNTQNLLTDGNWERVDLRALLIQEFAPFASEQIHLDGPPVNLDPRQTLGMGMAFHELATNAAKYGALSTPHGQVHVNWSVEGSLLRLDWIESAGPAVSQPKRRGFGSHLIESTINRSLEGACGLQYSPEGFRCTLSLPILPTSKSDA